MQWTKSHSKHKHDPALRKGWCVFCALEKVTKEHEETLKKLAEAEEERAKK